MATIQLRNINPLGAVDLPLVGRTLAAGEVFEIDRDVADAAGLLKQVGNFELVRGERNLDELGVKELKEYAADRGLDLGGASNKADIIAAIKKG